MAERGEVTGQGRVLSLIEHGLVVLEAGARRPRVPASGHLNDQAPERPQVSLPSNRAPHTLRRHPVHRPLDPASRLIQPRQQGQITDLGSPPPISQHIAGLDVPVHQSLRVQVVEGLGYLPGQAGDQWLWERAELGQQGLHGASFE